MSLKDELERYYKSDNFKKKVFEKVKSNPKLGNIESSARQYAAILTRMLDEAIALVKSENFILRMYGKHYTEVKFIPGQGWTIELRFDEDSAWSPSLLPDVYDDVYLPALFNNGYSASGIVYGYWETHGFFTNSRPERKAAHFIQSVVDEFNRKYADSGFRAVYNPVYDGMDWYDSLFDEDWF